MANWRKKDQFINFRADEWLVKKLDEILADRRSLNRSDLIRRALEKFIADELGETVNVELPRHLIIQIDEYVRKKEYTDRSMFLQMAVADRIEKEEELSGEKEEGEGAEGKEVPLVNLLQILEEAGVRVKI